MCVHEINNKIPNFLYILNECFWQSTEENCQAQKGWKDMIMRKYNIYFYIKQRHLPLTANDMNAWACFLILSGSISAQFRF